MYGSQEWTGRGWGTKFIDTIFKCLHDTKELFRVGKNGHFKPKQLEEKVHSLIYQRHELFDR